MKISDLFKKTKIIGLIGNVNEAKSNLLYHIISECKKEGKFNLYTYGLRCPVGNATQIYSVQELEQIKDSIIILDEVMSLWDLDNRMAKRQIENTLRLIFHNNNVLIISGLPENFKKFISGKINVFMFKKSTISDFINGSRAKNVLLGYKGYEMGSSVLDVDKGSMIMYDGIHYSKVDVPYYKEFDTKKDNAEIIVKKKIKEVKE